MGKKLKYCSSCEEGFAERFAFCPDCGASLQAFEMNPVTGEAETHIPEPDTAPEIENKSHQIINLAPITQIARTEPLEKPDLTAESFPNFEEDLPEVPRPAFLVEEPPEHVVETAAAGSYAGAQASNGNARIDEDSTASYPFASDSLVADGVAPPFRFPKFERESAPPFHFPKVKDEDYGLTVINDSNSKQKNGLLLGAAAVMITAMLTGVVYSIFAKNIDIGAIGDDNLYAWIPEVDPISIDLEQEKLKKDNSGGGGGGGNKEQDPASKGTNAAMMKDPLVAPSSHMDRVTDPSLKMQVGVKGPDRPMVDTTQPYGVPNGADKLSDGPGSGTGIGTGRNGGQGSGEGPGLGSGSGGGAGNGRGGGIGDGDGPNGGGPPPAIARGESTPVKIISKPKAPYTDAARQNNVQGSVTLKIVFLASGQIGSVTAVTRLPYGLTENAIAAAKQIRFEPKKVNGVPVTTSMTFQYGFNIY